MGSDPAAEHAPDRTRRRARGRVRGVPDRPHAGDERAVPALRRGDRPPAPSHWPAGRSRPAAIASGHLRLPRRRARRSAAGRAGGCRPRTSGRGRRAATTTGPGRGATSCPTADARDLRRRRIRRPVGLAPRGRRPVRRARPGGQRLGVDGERAAAVSVRRGDGREDARRRSRASSAAARTSTGRARSAAPTGTACCPARSTTTSASALAADPARPRLESTGRRARRRRPARQRPAPSAGPAPPTRRRATSSTSRPFELARDAGHERAVRGVRRARPVTEPPPHWPDGDARRARRPSGHLRRLARRDRVLRAGPAAAADRGRVGEGRARHRRPPLPVGRRRATRSCDTSAIGRANFGGGSKHGSTTAVGAHPAGASPYGLLDMAGNVWEWVSSAYAPYPYDADDGREDPAIGEPRVLRGGSFASPSLAWAALRDAQPQPPAAAASRTSASASRRGAAVIEHVDADRLRDLTLELVEVESPTGDTAEVARLYAQRLEELGMDGRGARRRLPGDADRDRPARGGEPGPTVVLNGHLDTVPIPHEPPRIEDGARLRPRQRRHEGRARLRGRGGARRRRVGRRSPASSCSSRSGCTRRRAGAARTSTWLLGEHGFTRRLRASSASSAGDTLVASRTWARRRSRSRSRGPGMPTHELQTPAGTPHPIIAAARVIEALAARNDELAAVEHPLGRRRDVLPRRGARRRLLQPLPDELPPRRHAPLGAGQHARGGRGGVPRAARRASRPRPAARSTSTCGSCAARTRSTPSTRSRSRCATPTRTSPARSCRAGRHQGRRRRRVLPRRRGIPTVYHGPVGSGAHGDVESMPVAELVRATKVYLRMLERLWA